MMNPKPLGLSRSGIRETELSVIIDSGDPVVTRIPVDPNCITLGRFKSIMSLNNGCYKFYFKSEDSEFGIVKEEVSDDYSTLPVDGDKIVAWVFTAEANHTSSFDCAKSSNDNLTNPMTSSRQNAIAPSLYSSQPIYHNDCQRSNQHLNQSSNTISVHLLLCDYNFLGITLVGSNDPSKLVDNGIYVSGISPGSLAEQDGRIEIGDRIIEVNGVSIRFFRNDDAIALFKSYVDKRGPLALKLERKQSYSPSYRENLQPLPHYTGSQTLQSVHMSAESLPSYDDLPIPEFGSDKTPKSRQQEPRIIRDTHSLPRSITPRSLYTSNTLGRQPTSNSLRLSLDTRSAYEPTTPSSIQDYNTALHFARDDIHTIYAAIRADATSLDIKDREWLKVVVRDAFMGSALVKWLSHNVHGFRNKREAKQYANKLLIQNYIRSPISNSKFSEKCYYTLT